MPAGLRVKPDSGPTVAFAAGGSVIRWGEDRPIDILPMVIAELRSNNNKTNGARELSMAIQRSEEALHWLQALERRLHGTSQDG